jgi:16S rRNA (cytosine967-C5)-methyltransferase
MVYGVVRMRGRLDHLLNLHLRKGLASLPPGMADILRLGAFEILCLDGTPAYAAVSQAVSATRRRFGSALARVTNGVLRSLAREGGGIERFPSLDEAPAAHLATWGSHPRWLVERWLRRYGQEGARSLTEANNRIPPTYLRPLDLAPEDAASRLTRAGVPASVGPVGSRTVRLAAGASPREALARIRGIVQDPAAGWVVDWIGAPAGERVVDLCAAPGGKAVALAALGARVVAADRSVRRLRLLGENVGRVELRIPAVAALGEAPPFRPVGTVLVDAPCSGTGTLARHPDARWRLAEADIRALSRVQDAILDGAAGIVRSGGLLVYSTCTLEPEENEERIEAFIRRHPGFILEGGEGVPEGLRDGFFLRVLPQRTGTDGAFAARLRRIA